MRGGRACEEDVRARRTCVRGGRACEERGVRLDGLLVASPSDSEDGHDRHRCVDHVGEADPAAEDRNHRGERADRQGGVYR